MEALTLSGGCHCGAVRFDIRISPPAALLDCNCSICARTGFLHLIVTAADFTLERGEAALVDYRFGSGVARHRFCGTCGIKSFYEPRSHPGSLSVNWRALDATEGIATVVTSFDGRDWEAARAALA